jgi:hypothetical protein
MNRLVSVLLVVAFAVQLGTAQKFSDRSRRIDLGLDAYRVPKETWAVLNRLVYTRKYEQARTAFKLAREQYPWDISLPSLGLNIAFLTENYSEIPGFLEAPPGFEVAFPEVAQLHRAGSSWESDAMCLVAHLKGFKTRRDPAELEASVLKKAWERRAGLPFGMVDERGVHADKEILVLVLIMHQNREHWDLLMTRAERLAPNDTFILELKAKRLMDEGSAGGPVSLLDQGLAMYKKALKAKASEERIKYLKKELVEAEKKTEWLKRVDEIRRRGG